MKTLILLVVLAVVCCVPAFGHADNNVATNLVMLAGTTCVDNGNLGETFVGANAILNLGRFSDPQGIIAPYWADDFHSNARASITDYITLTITFPSEVSITGIAWNSGGVAGAYWSDPETTPHWWASLDGTPIVDKNCDTGGLGATMGTQWNPQGNLHPHMYDPCGTQDERAMLAEAATCSVLVLKFTPILRGDPGAYVPYLAVRDINVMGSVVPEPSSILAILTGCAGVFTVIRRKRG